MTVVDSDSRGVISPGCSGQPTHSPAIGTVRGGRLSALATIRGKSLIALIGQMPRPTAVAACMKVVITIAPSTAALKNASRGSFGNGLLRRLGITGECPALPA